jgi:hypothetical protein
VKQVINWSVSAAFLIPVALGWYVSYRYLPGIDERQPWWPLASAHKNWLGQEGCVVLYGYPFSLLVASYCAKRIILTHCTKRGTAAYFFSLLVALSLPFIWFLCESEWFNNSSITLCCWVWRPVAIWFVPAMSFLLDLFDWGMPKPLKPYLKRSVVEVVVAFPIWAVIWGLFALYILEWGFV